MSDANNPAAAPAAPSNPSPAGIPPPTQRSGCLSFFMVLMGILLLLPGLCALGFGASSLFSSHYESGLTPFIVVGLMVGFGGIMLIRAAIRGRQG
jgi:hypothetical protein